MKQKMCAQAVLFGCLLSATSLSAQTTLPRDFSLGTDSIVLPESLRAAAGYPAWRMVTMNGKNAVPYTYCGWLLRENPWAQDKFGSSNFLALKNCADGITKVTRLNVDPTAPTVGNDAQFWRQRPVGYQYMVPDYTLSEATYDSLMDSAGSETISFVSNPVKLASYLEALQKRISALEEWKKELDENGGVMTQAQLKDWLTEGNYLQAGDVADAGLLTQEQADERYTKKDTLPEGEILTRKQADTLYVNKEVFDEFRRSFTIPDRNTDETKNIDESLLDDVMENDVVEAAVDWWRWWLIPLVLLVLFVGWFVWTKVSKRSKQKESNDQDEESSSHVAYVKQSDFSDLQKEVQSQKERLGDVEERTKDALHRIDDVREGLEALISVDADGMFNAPGFTNEKLKQLGDEPFELTMPGSGVARKKVRVYNRGDYIEMFGLKSGHDRVDKIDVIAVFKHLAKARLPENDWITGVTAQKAA